MRNPMPTTLTSFQCKPEFFKLIKDSAATLHRDIKFGIHRFGKNGLCLDFDSISCNLHLNVHSQNE